MAPRRKPESKTVNKGIVTGRIGYSFRSEMVPNRPNGRKKMGVKFISHFLCRIIAIGIFVCVGAGWLR